MNVRDWFRRDYWVTDRDMDEDDDLGALLVATGELGPEEPTAPPTIDWSRFQGIDATSVLKGQLDAVRAERDRLREEVARLLDERGSWAAMVRYVAAQRDAAGSRSKGGDDAIRETGSWQQCGAGQGEADPEGR